MFTGLVEELGVLREIIRGSDSAGLKIESKKVLQGSKVGDSISVNGVCLTVTSLGGDSFTADVMAETLARTGLGSLKPGDRVNLERALMVGDRMGGHMVSGHIDGVGVISRRETRDIAILISVTAPQEIMRYVVRKGSVAVDGISLTIAECEDKGFTVSLIPHTAAVTSLGYKNVGSSVNLEADIIGKYVEKFVAAFGDRNGIKSTRTGLNMEKLAEHGFV